MLCFAIALATILGGSIYGLSRDSGKYCRVRFGTVNSIEVILKVTSDTVLLFRSGNIESTPERYPLNLSEGVTIPPIDVGNGVSYTITSISQCTDSESILRHALMIHVKIEGETSFTQYCDVELSDTTRNMKEAHFDGPLSVGPVTLNWEIPTGTQFVIGGDPTDIRTMVATLDKTSGCWTVAESGDDKFPEGVHPTVTVEFPAIESATPLVRTFALDKFC